MGHWDIEGAGALFLKRKTLLHLWAAILFFVELLSKRVF